MKNSIRLIALIVMIALVALSLCSCKDLDEKKASQAFYTSEDKSTIEFRGENFKLIQMKGNLSFIMGDNALWNCYVTERDVPVLLASQYGSLFSFRSDDDGRPTIITTMDYNWYTAYGLDEDTGRAYCREDLYDSVKAIIDSAKLDSLFVEYYEYDLDKVDEYHTGQRFVREKIDDKWRDVIFNTVADEKATEIPEDKIDFIYDSLTLSICDKNALITRSDGSGWYEVIKADDGRFFVQSGASYTYKLVPEKDRALLDDMMKRYAGAIEEDIYGDVYYENEQDVSAEETNAPTVSEI